MSVAASQRQIFLHLLGNLRPHWHRDAALPARIQALLSRHREFGSRDRRLYRELIYTTLRYLPWIEPLLERESDEAVRRIAWFANDSPATKPFRAEFATGEAPGGDRGELLPGWFRAHCPELFTAEEISAQLRRAPLWLRLQTDDPATVFAEFAARGWASERSALLADALELRAEADLTATDAWRTGRIEVQDLGSQFILESVGLARGERWLDACAGAGGKTLQLARLLGPGGQVTAHDVRAAALAELRTRASRAGLSNVTVATTIEGTFDGVLVDAPCSGSGTWRRAPHLKWVTWEASIARAAALQSSLLAQFSVHVRPGGRLVYATCSLSSMENEAVVAAFIASHPDFRSEPPARTFNGLARPGGLLFLPARHDTDGFFVASLRRN